MTALLLIVAMAQVSTGAPVASSVSPDVLAPYRPAQLTIQGEGFNEDCRVLIGPFGKLIPVRSEAVSDSEIVVNLPAGYGPTPQRRQLIVDCAGGARSEPLWLTIAAGGDVESAEAETGQAAPSPDPTGGDVTGELPRVLRLDPGATAAGEPFTLTVIGEGFQEGATVEALANANAGTSRRPEYRSIAFPTEFASDTVLIVDFDRGLAPSPRLREIVVVNPDGGRSPPMYLEVTRRMP